MSVSSPSRVQRIAAGYRGTALVVMNLLVLFIVLNVVIWVCYSVKDRLRPPPMSFGETPVESRYGMRKIRQNYPGMTDAEIQAFLTETWTRGFMYAPFVEFREKAFAGKYVNVDETGFRRGTGQAVWPPARDAVNIFLFGGSTTFGYGVRDGDAIPSRLQEILAGKANVYNFGTAFYYSSQERVFFEEFLAAGHVPTIAIFIDGINEFAQPVPGTEYSPRVQALFKGEPMNITPPWWRSLPLAKLANSIQKRAAARNPASPKKPENYADARVLDFVIDRYLANQALIRSTAVAYGVKPLFIWQPVPTFAHPPATAPYPVSEGAHKYSEYGYPRFAERLKTQPPAADFVWLAELQAGLSEQLYVDAVHYNPVFSRKIAEAIAAEIQRRGLIQ